MRIQRVSACLRSDQPFFPLAIAGLSCTLSLWLTLRFCRQLWPGEGGVVLVLLGVTWEAAKVLFGPVGLRWVCSGPLKQRFGGLALTAMALVLAAGSVAASVACFSQAQGQASAKILAATPAYAAAMADANSLGRQIEIALGTAADFTKHSRDSKSMEASDSVGKLREARAGAVASVERIANGIAGEPTAAALGALLPGVPMGTVQRGAQGAVAVMLELISVAAVCLTRQRASASMTWRDSDSGDGYPQTGNDDRVALEWITRIRDDVERIAARAARSGDSDGAMAVAPGTVMAKASIPSTMRYRVADTMAAGTTVEGEAGTVPTGTMLPGTMTESSPGTIPAGTTAMGTMAASTMVEGAAGTMPTSTMAASTMVEGVAGTVPTSTKAMGTVAEGTPGTMPAGTMALGTVAEGWGTIMPGTVIEDAGTMVPGTITEGVPGTMPAPAGTMALGTVAESAPGTMPAGTMAMGTVAEGAAGTAMIESGTGAPETRHTEATVQEGRALVLDHKVAPTARAIKRALKVGQAVALRILAEMHAEGLLARTPRGYVLVA